LCAWTTVTAPTTWPTSAPMWSGRGLSRAVLWHCEDQIIRYDNQIIVF
jgi:hypothetical protein